MALYKLTAYDLLCTAIVNGNWYVTTDTKSVFYDSNGVRLPQQTTMIATESERLNNVSPTLGSYYYVWETNTLWIYNRKWIVVEGSYSSPSSGFYYDNHVITPTDNEGEVIDNNGLLHDGSVVVRDNNRIIKGRLYIEVDDEDCSNLIFSSYMGGGIKLLPSGSVDSTGALEIFSANTYTGQYDHNGVPIVTGNTGELTFFGDMYVTDGTNRFKVLTSRDGYTYVAGEGIVLGDTDIYILLLAEPEDWETNYTNYYKLVDNEYVQNDDPTYADDTFYKKETVPNSIAVKDYQSIVRGITLNGGDPLPIVDGIVDIIAGTSSVISGTTAPTPDIGEDDSLYVQYIAGGLGDPDTFDAMYVKLNGDWVTIDTSNVKMQIMTQAQYDQITPEQDVIYFITDGGAISVSLIDDNVTTTSKTWSSTKINTQLATKANVSDIPSVPIKGVKRNGTELTPDANGKVNVTVPTQVSDLNNDSNFSSVSYTRDVSTGTKIGSITIDGTSTDIYAPNGGGGGANSLNNLTDVTITSPTDGQILKYNPSPNVETVSGSVANFTTPYALPLVESTVDIDYKDTTGFSAVNVTKTGKNLAATTPFEIGTFTESSPMGTPYDSMKSYASRRARVVSLIAVPYNEQITLSCSSNYTIFYTGFDRQGLYKNVYAPSWDNPVTITKQIYFIAIAIKRNDEAVITDADLEAINLQIETGASATTYDSTGEKKIVNLGGTIYGGSVDITNGTVTSTKAQDGTDLPDPVITQISPTVLSTLVGVNNIWSDSGDTEVEYIASYSDNWENTNDNPLPSSTIADEGKFLIVNASGNPEWTTIATWNGGNF